jgi:hypothetical protein
MAPSQTSTGQLVEKQIDYWPEVALWERQE